MYSIAFRTTVVLDPADTTIYYWGLDGILPTTTPGDHRDVRVPRAVTLRAAYVTATNGTPSEARAADAIS